MFLLLTLAAETANQLDIAPMLPAISTIGSMGFAVWYAWYITTVAIPKLLDSHKQERTEMQARFDAQIHDLLEDNRQWREIAMRQMQPHAP